MAQQAEKLAREWFRLWETGEFLDLPITEDFVHISPYGTIQGKKAYLDLVEANKDKFLGHSFEIHDLISNQDKVCIRYTALKSDFTLEVTEWHYVRDNLIHKIVAYYNIEGEIKEDRKLSIPE
ncbi:nuclear transport factor 2 family protein [Flagellimonas myxillae]|uniref:nuclear transport factor 2 family protein n=1 Tax=Flagellimonas myxillae TaxID=2942214 RepID=UPI00201ECBEE|nr:nuclear transport factor 2 family protein [Muricauda myxillae]MCL6267272.1 nuclear transport factor 2 family protein [Muricauda myxillae]